MASLHRLKNRGVICFLALLLGLFSVAVSDTNFYFRSFEYANYNKLAEVFDFEMGTWLSMNRISITSGASSTFQYRFKSSSVINPIVIRSTNADGSFYCFQTNLSSGYNGINESETGVLRQYFVSPSGTWVSSVAASRKNLPANYQPTPYIFDFGFSMDNFSRAFAVGVGACVGTVIGGFCLFLGIRKGISNLRGV